MSQSLVERIDKCENENRRLKKRLFRQNLFWLLTVLAAVTGTAIAAHTKKPAVFGRIKAKEITIVDSTGTVRARLGGNLPNAVYNGKEVSRGAKAAGLLIYDKNGDERGGYVTLSNDKANNAILTLDAGAAGKNKQVALFVAGRTGATALKLWNDKNSVTLRSSNHGAHMTIVNGGQVKFQKPAITKIGTDACHAYRNFAVKHSISKAARFCYSRFTKSACRSCLSNLSQ